MIERERERERERGRERERENFSHDKGTSKLDSGTRPTKIKK